jgi:hypothetical protein
MVAATTAKIDAVRILFMVVTPPESPLRYRKIVMRGKVGRKEFRNQNR